MSGFDTVRWEDIAVGDQLPPMVIDVTATVIVAGALATLDRTGRCTDAGRQPNPNPAFSGEYQQWLDCGGTATDQYVLAANPVDGRPITVVVLVQVLQDSDFAAVQAAFTQYAVS